MSLVISVIGSHVAGVSKPPTLHSRQCAGMHRTCILNHLHVYLLLLLLPLSLLLQMVALTCLLLTKDGAQGLLGVVAAAAGAPLLAVAAWLTAHSLALYVAGLWKFMK